MNKPASLSRKLVSLSRKPASLARTEDRPRNRTRPRALARASAAFRAVLGPIPTRQPEHSRWSAHSAQTATKNRVNGQLAQSGFGPVHSCEKWRGRLQPSRRPRSTEAATGLPPAAVPRAPAAAPRRGHALRRARGAEGGGGCRAPQLAHRVPPLQHVAIGWWRRPR